jgi:hypothetical protein
VTNEVIAILSALGVSEAHVKVKIKKAAHSLGKMSPPGARRVVGPEGGGKLGDVDVGWSRERVTGQQELEFEERGELPRKAWKGCTGREQ